jgi:hypothetical protein
VGFWENAKGYFSVDRKTQARLVYERPSTQVLFTVLVSQALTHRIWVDLPGRQHGEIWNEGTRTWGLRGLAVAARMSVATVRRGIARLESMGLIRKVSNKLGTVIQVLRFYQYRRRNSNACDERPAPATTVSPHRGGTAVAKIYPYRRDPILLQRSPSDPVAVARVAEESFIRPIPEEVAQWKKSRGW